MRGAERADSRTRGGGRGKEALGDARGVQRPRSTPTLSPGRSDPSGRRAKAHGRGLRRGGARPTRGRSPAMPAGQRQPAVSAATATSPGSPGSPREAGPPGELLRQKGASRAPACSSSRSPRVSNQAMTGAHASPEASSRTPLSARPATPTPRTRTGPIRSSARCTTSVQQAHREGEQGVRRGLRAAGHGGPRVRLPRRGRPADRGDRARWPEPGRAEVQADGDLRRHGVSSPEPRSIRATGTWTVAGSQLRLLDPLEQPRRGCPPDSGARVVDDGDRGIEGVGHDEVAEPDQRDIRPPLAVHDGDDAQGAARRRAETAVGWSGSASRLPSRRRGRWRWGSRRGRNARGTAQAVVGQRLAVAGQTCGGRERRPSSHRCRRSRECPWAMRCDTAS